MSETKALVQVKGEPQEARLVLNSAIVMAFYGLTGLLVYFVGAGLINWIG